MKLYLWISLGIIIITINLVNNFSGIHSYRAVYVNEMINNTEFPKEKKQGPFIVGVLGESEVTKELRELSSQKKYGKKEIVINTLKSIEEVKQCNIVYIPASKSEKATEAIKIAKDKSVLVVTEGPGMLEKGATVNFVAKGNKIDYEVNELAAKEAHLSFSSSLLSKARGLL